MTTESTQSQANAPQPDPNQEWWKYAINNYTTYLFGILIGSLPTPVAKLCIGSLPVLIWGIWSMLKNKKQGVKGTKLLPFTTAFAGALVLIHPAQTLQVFFQNIRQERKPNPDQINLLKIGNAKKDAEIPITETTKLIRVLNINRDGTTSDPQPLTGIDSVDLSNHIGFQILLEKGYKIVKANLNFCDPSADSQTSKRLTVFNYNVTNSGNEWELKSDWKLNVGKYSVLCIIQGPDGKEMEPVSYEFLTRRVAKCESGDISKTIGAMPTGDSTLSSDSQLVSTGLLKAAGWYWNSDLPFGRHGSSLLKFSLDSFKQGAILRFETISDVTWHLKLENGWLVLRANSYGSARGEALTVCKMEGGSATLSVLVSCDSKHAYIETFSCGGIKKLRVNLSPIADKTIKGQQNSLTVEGAICRVSAVIEQTFATYEYNIDEYNDMTANEHTGESSLR